MQKVFLLIPTYSSYLPAIARTFEKLNWQTRIFDYRRGNLPIRILRFLPIFGAEAVTRSIIDQKIKQINRKYKPNLILTVKGELLSANLLKSLKNSSNFLADWFPDPMSQWELMKKITPYYDFFFHFDPLIVRKLKQRGYQNVFYLPFASEIQEQSRVEKRYDISFVGTYSPFREKLLSNLRDFDLNIWGDSRWFQSGLRSYTKGGRIPQSTMKTIIKKTKININIHFDAPREGANLRTFEVTGCGGFLLLDYIKDLDRLFKVGEEVICYKSSNDLIRKCKYYLKENIVREKIAFSGYQRAKKDHNYLKRVREMLRLIYG